MLRDGSWNDFVRLVNSFFYVFASGKKCLALTHTLSSRVSNRTGQLVYHSPRVNSQWNGTILERLFERIVSIYDL